MNLSCFRFRFNLSLHIGPDRRSRLSVLSTTFRQNVSHSMHREFALALVGLRKVTLSLTEERPEVWRQFFFDIYREELFRTFRSEFGFSFRVESASGLPLSPQNTSRLLVQFFKEQMGASKAELCEKERNRNMELELALWCFSFTALLYCILLICCCRDCCASKFGRKVRPVGPVGPVPPFIPVGRNIPVAPNSVRHSFT